MNWKKNIDKIKAHKIIISILIFSCVLLLINVGKRTFWMDETAVLEYLKHNPIEFLIEYFKFPDNHPPLYYALVNMVAHVLPSSELTIRLISVLGALGIVFMVYKFSRIIWFEKKYAYLSAFFTAFSSYFVLIGQMARYHSLAALFSLISLYFFYLLTHGKWNKKNTLWYVLSAIGTCLADYPHFIYLIGITSAYVLYLALKKKLVGSLWYWIKIQCVILLSFTPMVWLLFHRIFIQGDGGFEKHNLLANSLVHILLAIVFHVYVFFFGENIFPWDWVVSITGGLLLCYVLYVVVRGMIKKTLLPGYMFILGLCASLIVINTLFLNVADPRYNFIVYPKYVFIAFPLFIMALVGSLAYIRSKKIQYLCVVVWFAVASFGLYNFYTVQNYINASYFNTFKSFEFVRDHAKMGDLVMINGDLNAGVYSFYKEKYFQQVFSIRQDELERIPEKTRMWLFSTSSDDQNVNQSSENRVPEGFIIIDRLDSVPLDPTLKKYKEKILGYESYEYKYSVFLLEKI